MCTARDNSRFRGERGYRPQQNNDLSGVTKKIALATYDGTSDTSARAWVHNMDIYLSLRRMLEREAIQFAVLHLDEVAYDWWHHGLVTQDHAIIHSYVEFIEWLIARFYCKDTKFYYWELAHIRQTRNVESFVNEFQHIVVMVPDMYLSRCVMLFIEGLQDKLKGLVRAFRPTSLKEAIDVTFRLDTPPTPYQANKKPFRDSRPPHKANTSKDKGGPPSRPPKMVQESRNELRRKKLCFSCKEPWEPGHRCLGKGKVHLIEVTSEISDEDIPNIDAEDSLEEVEQEYPQLELDTLEPLASAKVTIATLSNYPKFHAFHLKATLRSQQGMSLVDTGATHNFIN